MNVKLRNKSVRKELVLDFSFPFSVIRLDGV